MRDAQERLSALSADELNAVIARGEALVRDVEPSNWTVDQINSAWDCLHAYEMQKRPKQGAETFSKLDEAIEAQIEKQGHTGELVGHLFEWGLLAIQHAPERKDDFVCIPIYQRLFDAIAKGPVSQHHRLLELRLQLMRHYNYWLNNNGNEESLAEEDYNYLQEHLNDFETVYEEIVDAAETREDFDATYALYRVAAQYYFAVEKPNDGMGCLKAALEDQPKITGYKPVFRAALLLEIGKIFMGFKKAAVALKYFSEALEIYTEAGEEQELLAVQAQSWVDLAKKG